MQPIDPARLAQELAAARPQLDATQQPLALTLYRLLAQGRPVSPEQIAEQAGVDAGRVAGLLERRYGVELDANRSVVGFWGLTSSPTPHRLDIDGQRLYAWCAWDTLSYDWVGERLLTGGNRVGVCRDRQAMVTALRQLRGAIIGRVYPGGLNDNR
jgi:hypothetical protein